MSEDIILEIVFSLIGGLFVIVGVVLYIRTRSFIEGAQEAIGKVIEMAYISGSDDGGGYAPVYQFRSMDGQDIVIQDRLSSNPPQFKVGQEIAVLYDPGNPREARIKKWMNLYFLPVIFGVLGLIFGGVGIGLVITQALRVSGK